MDLWIWQVIRLGYKPRIIISYRDFAANARSFYIVKGLGLPEFAECYRRINRSALLMLDVFGGCAIGFEELVGASETAWADALSQATGLNREALLENRNRRLKQMGAPSGTNPPGPPLRDPGAERVYEDLLALTGVYVPPSPEILRKWR